MQNTLYMYIESFAMVTGNPSTSSPLCCDTTVMTGTSLSKASTSALPCGDTAAVAGTSSSKSNEGLKIAICCFADIVSVKSHFIVYCIIWLLIIVITALLNDKRANCQADDVFVNANLVADDNNAVTSLHDGLGGVLVVILKYRYMQSLSSIRHLWPFFR